MKQELNITIVQTTLIWENVEANLVHFSEKLKNITGSDLIVLPEMFTTGFAVDRTDIAEEPDGKGFQWMQKTAREKNCVITGSIAVKENGKLYNRLYWVRPDGSFESYDKRHLFQMADEHKFFSRGEKKLIVDLHGWIICPLICYDLRFPVWSRNRLINNKAEYDILIYVANWPEVRSYPWKQLLIARAIENQCFVVGVNRIGQDGNKYPHSGDSAIINARGEIISKIIANEDKAETVSLQYLPLEEFRKVFPAGKDADPFELT